MLGAERLRRCRQIKVRYLADPGREIWQLEIAALRCRAERDTWGSGARNFLTRCPKLGENPRCFRTLTLERHATLNQLSHEVQTEAPTVELPE